MTGFKANVYSQTGASNHVAAHRQTNKTVEVYICNYEIIEGLEE